MHRHWSQEDRGGYAIPYQRIVGPICARDYKGIGNEYVMEGKLIVEAMMENMGSTETYQRVSGPLMANSHPGSYTGQDAFSDMLVATEYVVRRLTPLECCRLQGFPDNWAEELGIPEPTQEEIDHWRQVFRTHMEAMGENKKEKTDNQIRKWLKDPESDSAKYKMWGNGIALPCAMFVMEGIAMVLEQENQNRQYTECRNHNSTKEQEREWNRMVKDLQNRTKEENDERMDKRER